MAYYAKLDSGSTNYGVYDASTGQRISTSAAQGLVNYGLSAGNLGSPTAAPAPSTPAVSGGTITRTSSAPTPVPQTSPTMQSVQPALTPTPPPPSQNINYTTSTATNQGMNTALNQGTNLYGLNPSSSNWLQLQPGETTANYNARIAAANPNLPAPGTVSPTGVAGLGATAPSSGIINPNIGPTNAPTPTFSGIVGGLAGTSALGSPTAAAAGTGLLATSQNQPYYTQALDTYNKAYTAYQNALSNIAAQFGKMETSDQALPVVLGQEGALQKQYAAQLDALQGAVSSASNALNAANTAQGNVISGLSAAGQIGNTAQGTAQSGLTSAGQLAAPSGNFPFVFNPLTGTYSNTTTGQTGLVTPQMAADAVISGQMSYPDAISSLGYLGSTAQSQLQSAIQTKNPSFNFAQAQSLASTQGQVSPQLQMAQKALNNLTSTFSQVPWWQSTGIPAINTLGNLVAGITGFSLGSATAKQNAISEARTQVANALGVMTNTTPTAWTATVQSWFPDNATPDQVNAGIEQFSNLAQNRQQIYGTPGSVAPFSSSETGGSTSIFHW